MRQHDHHLRRGRLAERRRGRHVHRRARIADGRDHNTATLRLTAVALTGNVPRAQRGRRHPEQHSGANLTVERSTISGNTAGTIGGAIYNSGRSRSPTRRSRATRRTPAAATGRGGGIYTDGTATIVNSTIVDNRAFRGAGIGCRAARTAILKNTIVAQNTATGRASPATAGRARQRSPHRAATSRTRIPAASPRRETCANPPARCSDRCRTTAAHRHAGAAGRQPGDRPWQRDRLPRDRPARRRPAPAGGCDIGAYELGPPSVTTSGASGVGVTRASVAGTLTGEPGGPPPTGSSMGPTTAYGSATAVAGVRAPAFHPCRSARRSEAEGRDDLPLPARGEQRGRDQQGRRPDFPNRTHSPARGWPRSVCGSIAAATSPSGSPARQHRGRNCREVAALHAPKGKPAGEW